MLMPEIALLAAATALLLTLLNCLLIFAARRSMARQMSDLRIELDANLSAGHQLARHVRGLQKSGSSARSETQTNADQEDRYGLGRNKTAEHPNDAYRDSASHWAEGNRADTRSDSRSDARSDTRSERASLADKLGLSESEAEIVSHLKPRRSMGQMVRESA
tara:strand:- start:1391 stop:1876 length:486 start_codon:yes stop_codon:yes gene_type:complete